MKRAILFAIIILGLVCGRAWAGDTLVSYEKTQAEMEEEDFPIVGDEGVVGERRVDPRDWADIVKEQAKAREKKYKDIKQDSTLSYDEEGRPIYVTSDGVRHRFGDGYGNDVTIEDYQSAERARNSEFEKTARDYGKAYEEKVKAEQSEAAEAFIINRQVREAAKAKREAQAKEIGLSE